VGVRLVGLAERQRTVRPPTTVLRQSLGHAEDGVGRVEPGVVGLGVERDDDALGVAPQEGRRHEGRVDHDRLRGFRSAVFVLQERVMPQCFRFQPQ